MIGGKRTATSMHVDTYGVSTVQKSLVGRKLWLLMPPETSDHIGYARDFTKHSILYLGLDYISTIFPKIKEKYGDEIKDLWFIQNPGETVFLPAGWWHVVINLDENISFSNKIFYENTFDIAWIRMLNEESEISRNSFLDELKLHKPHLYDKAILMMKERENKIK